MLKYALLALLNHKAMTGYELEGFISATIAHFWTAKLSQIYRTLKQLEAAGWIVSKVEKQDGKPDKRIYTLTDEGRTELSIWRETLVTEIDDLRLPTLMRFFFYGERDPENVLIQLKVWLELHQQRASYFERDLPNSIDEAKKEIAYTEQDVFFWEATRKLGRRYEETYVEWLEEVIEQLQARNNYGA